MFNTIHNHSAQKISDTTDEQDDLLDAILAQIIRATYYGDLSIAQTIRKIVAAEGTFNQEIVYAKEALERNGIKIIKHHTSRLLFFNAAIL